MQHPELLPIGMLFMMLSALPGLWLGRRIRKWRTYLGVLALSAAGGCLAWYLRDKVDIGYFAFLFSPSIFCFALAMGSNCQATDDRRRDYNKRCLDAQQKQLEADLKHFNPLLAADTWTAIAELQFSLDSYDKACEAYVKAAAIYAVEKGNHPSLAGFYLASSTCHRKLKRNLDADRLALKSRECRLPIEY
jgi:hypothetical protein